MKRVYWCYPQLTYFHFKNYHLVYLLFFWISNIISAVIFNICCTSSHRIWRHLWFLVYQYVNMSISCGIQPVQSGSCELVFKILRVQSEPVVTSKFTIQTRSVVTEHVQLNCRFLELVVKKLNPTTHWCHH